MAFSRYLSDRVFVDKLSTAQKVKKIRYAIKIGSLAIIRNFVTSGDDRLDTLAGSIYGDAKYWWVLAAASDIGWGLQIPPGTIISVVSLSEVERL